jgi:hypothetical protein
MQRGERGDKAELRSADSRGRLSLRNPSRLAGFDSDSQAEYAKVQ